MQSVLVKKVCQNVLKLPPETDYQIVHQTITDARLDYLLTWQVISLAGVMANITNVEVITTSDQSFSTISHQ